VTTQNPPAAQRTPEEVVAHLVERTNAHDLEGLVACFAPDYVLTNPVHPSRSFVGVAPVRSNWEQFFAAIPDIQIAVSRTACAGDEVWIEQSVTGTRVDGATHDLRGIMVLTVRDGLVRANSFYLEPVEHAGLTNDETARMYAAGRS
jgi:ketosteroid isomerase-like protein